MADQKISQLTGAATPLAGTETLPVVQSGSTRKVAVSDLTSGRTVSMSALSATTTALVGNVAQQGILDVGISGATSSQYLTGGAGNNLATGIFKIGSGANRGASVQGFRGASSNIHSLDLYSYNSADVHVMRMESGGDAKVMTGNLVIGTSGKGIDFSATTEGSGTMTSELLADYEEGTWTPSQGAGLTVVGAFSSAGRYTKIGRLVTVSGFVQGGTSVSVSAGNELTTNLPFTVGANGVGVMIANNQSQGGQLVAAGTTIYTTGMTAVVAIFFTVTYSV